MNLDGFHVYDDLTIAQVAALTAPPSGASSTTIFQDPDDPGFALIVIRGGILVKCILEAIDIVHDTLKEHLANGDRI